MWRASFTGTKFGGDGKARAGKNSFLLTPFLFARPSAQFGARSAPLIPFKKGSDFVKQTHTLVKPTERFKVCKIARLKPTR
jgi:hypothetical protein